MFVIGGSNACLKFLEENAKSYNVHVNLTFSLIFCFKVVKRLDVSGAFHTPLMNEANEKLSAALMLDEFKMELPHVNILSNVTGRHYPRRRKQILRISKDGFQVLTCGRISPIKLMRP